MEKKKKYIYYFFNFSLLLLFFVVVVVVLVRKSKISQKIEYNITKIYESVIVEGISLHYDLHSICNICS